MSWNVCPITTETCIQGCKGHECRAGWHAEDLVTCGGGPPGDPNGEKTALLLEFARFLHTLPAEAGFDVGPARVKFDAHGAVERVLWATQADTERWVQTFLGTPMPTDAVATRCEGCAALRDQLRDEAENSAMTRLVSDLVKRDAHRFRKLLMQHKHWLGVFKCGPDGAPSDSLSHVELKALLDAMEGPELDF